jgi:RNA polymerase sigma-70 factor (ECF subfamily)
MAQMQFPTTHWSLLMQARGSENRAQEALQQLCTAYWYPLFSFARLSLRVTPEEAEDLTQGFFEHILRRRVLARVEQNSGNFRNYLLVCFRNFYRSGVARVRAAKREGSYSFVSIDRSMAERRLAAENVNQTPELFYDRAWALEALNRAYRRTELHYSAQGKLDLFHRLRPFLEHPQAQPYAEAANALNKTEGAIKTEVYRLRRVFSEAFRSIVSSTVLSPAEVELEVQYLVRLLTR